MVIKNNKMAKKTTNITKELLIADGWVLTTGEVGFLMEKLIENRNPINDTSEDTDIKLVIHHFFNVEQFAVLFPDGGMLNFAASSMEELREFEERIDFYDCPY